MWAAAADDGAVVVAVAVAVAAAAVAGEGGDVAAVVGGEGGVGVVTQPAGRNRPAGYSSCCWAFKYSKTYIKSISLKPFLTCSLAATRFY